MLLQPIYKMAQKAPNYESDSSEKGLSSFKPRLKLPCNGGHVIQQIPDCWWEKTLRGARGHTGTITMLVSEVPKPSRAVYHEELCAFEKQFWVCCWALADMEGMAKGQQTDVGLELPDESWVLPVPSGHRFGWGHREKEGAYNQNQACTEQRA